MKASAPARRSRLTCFLLLLLVVASANLHAVPITYTLTVGPDPLIGGKLGNITFDSTAQLKFTFDGDTDNVFAWGPLPSILDPFKGPVSGYEILMGVASVEITNGTTGALIAKGTFKNEAGIFVSVDHTNIGVGFGSFGVPVSDASFPGQPIYPYALVNFPSQPDLTTYDLKSDISIGGLVLSCIGFPTATCGAPKALPTTGGDLYINPAGVQEIMYFGGPFTAQVHPVTIFSFFHAVARTSGRDSGNFSLTGDFTLGNASNGINPLAEPVTLRFGAYSATLPPGSFKTGEEGQFVFRGFVNGVQLQLEILPTKANSFRIRAAAFSADLTGIFSPVTVVLTIGDDSGMTSVNLGREDD